MPAMFLLSVHLSRYPGDGGCNPIGVQRSCGGKSRNPGAGWDPCPSSRGAFRGGTATETVQIQVLAELWVPAVAGMAKEARVEIAALLVEGNWITAAKAESQISSSPPAGRGEREALGTARRPG